MKVPLSWLSEFIDIELPPHQIANILTQAGMEVEAIEKVAPKFSKVIIGKVTGVDKHPTADKLCVAQVTDGSETYQVVCGAPNCRSGLKTAFAMTGASIEDPSGKALKVKKTKLRGVESYGMLCSSHELGLGAEEDGIIEFADHLKEGADISEMYADTVFDIALTPNLGHCASILGIARELSALTGKRLKWTPYSINETTDQCSQLVKVDVQDQQRCPRYACRIVENLKVGPSPEWLEKKLVAAGIRPVNNLVDITNYVLLETGQPLHAFDFNHIKGNQIIVRCAKERESICTLDDKERQLQPNDLLICDAEQPLAIAGVMGGLESEVSNKTTTVLIESAYFEANTIRRTSQRLNLQTDASYHFERGTDPNMVVIALDRTAKLMEELAGGTTVSGIVDSNIGQFQPKTITCSVDRVNKLIGLQLSITEIHELFSKLNMQVEESDTDLLKVTVPTYRSDLQEEVDLIEEVARLYGYDNIPKATPTFHASTQLHHPMFLFERSMRKRLVAAGLQEFVSSDLVGPSILKIIDPETPTTEAHISVLNPNSVELSVLRTSLLPSFLRIVKYNSDHQVRNIFGFEIGRVHIKDQDKFIEQTVMGMILTGHRKPPCWDEEAKEVDFYDAKGILEGIFEQLHFNEIKFKKSEQQALHDGRQASIWLDDLEIGFIGEVHPSVTRRLDFKQRLYFIEVNLTQLLPKLCPTAKMESLSIYPASERDWTITLDENVTAQQLFDAIHEIPSNLLESVTIIDLYRNVEKLGPNRKNVTLRFVYRNKKKTIKQEAVDNEHARIIEATQKEVLHAN